MLSPAMFAFLTCVSYLAALVLLAMARRPGIFYAMICGALITWPVWYFAIYATELSR